jgi:glycosyltransferase involved in cell wall biosynthesis
MTRPLHFLFAAWMVGGNLTLFDNMKEEVMKPPVARTSWVPVEMYPDDWITRLPPVSLSGTWRNSAATGMRIRSLQRERGQVDAAYVFGHSLVTFLWRFRQKVPYIVATDMTPMYCATHGLSYAVPDFNPQSLVSRMTDALTRRVYQGAYHLLPLSTGVRDSLLHDYGVAPERVTVLPPGIDLERWTPVDRISGTGGERAKKFRVLHVGADFLRKGGDILVRLAEEEEFRDVEFHIVTTTRVSETPPNVILHYDVKPNSPELVALHHQADLFALPTHADTYSVAALEAMATGLPVIISDVGGIADIIVQGETGYLIGRGDVHALRHRIRTLRGNQNLRQAMGVQARKRVEQKFSLERQTAFVLGLMAEAAQAAQASKSQGSILIRA